MQSQLRRCDDRGCPLFARQPLREDVFGLDERENEFDLCPVWSRRRKRVRSCLLDCENRESQSAQQVSEASECHLCF
ncbi:hypothetical protein KC340_g68 [Hortaea werneckii]|nr:hypothetical protein KC340_g68 [Hortaea werneckii]